MSATPFKPNPNKNLDHKWKRVRRRVETKCRNYKIYSNSEQSGGNDKTWSTTERSSEVNYMAYRHGDAVAVAAAATAVKCCGSRRAGDAAATAVKYCGSPHAGATPRRRR